MRCEFYEFLDVGFTTFKNQAYNDKWSTASLVLGLAGAVFWDIGFYLAKKRRFPQASKVCTETGLLLIGGAAVVIPLLRLFIKTDKELKYKSTMTNSYSDLSLS